MTVAVETLSASQSVVVRNALGIAVGARPKMAFAGDSQGVSIATLASSPFLNALRQQPRHLEWDIREGMAFGGGMFAFSGSGSGNSSTINLNSPTRIAAMIAYAPDIILISCDEQGNAAPSTIANIATYITAIRTGGLPSCRFIINVPTPRFATVATGAVTSRVAGTVMSANTARTYGSALTALRTLSASVPGVYLYDLRSIMYDPTTLNGPKGGGAGAANALLGDGVHFSVALGLNTEAIARADRVMDALGIAKIPPALVVKTDYYDATFNPQGSVLPSVTSGGVVGSTGLFDAATTATATGTGISGTAPAGWNTAISSDNAELTATISAVTVTDKYGGSFPGLRITPTAAAPLTADRTITIIQTPTFIDVTKKYLFQMRTKLTNPIGLFAVAPFMFGGFTNTNEVDYSAAAIAGSVPADRYDGFTGEFIDLQTSMFQSANNAFSVGKKLQFAQGSQPNSGTIDLFQWGDWPQ